MKKLKNIIIILLLCVTSSSVTGYITWARTTAKNIEGDIDGAFFDLSTDQDLARKVAQHLLIYRLNQYSKLPEVFRVDKKVDKTNDYEGKPIHTRYQIDIDQYNQRRLTLDEALKAVAPNLDQHHKDKYFEILDNYFVPQSLYISGEGLNEALKDAVSD